MLTKEVIERTERDMTRGLGLLKASVWVKDKWVPAKPKKEGK